MSEYNPNALSDDDRMPIGKHRSKRLGEVPDWYWRWFLDQPWCDEYPALVEYANHVVEDE